MKTQRWLKRSSLREHKQFKRELIPPFNQLSPRMQQIYWARDLLPEFVWIDSLVQEYGENAAPSIFNDFLSALDPLVPEGKHILDGTITSFRLVPDDLRAGFITLYRGKIEWAVTRPFRHLLAVYPDCPMNWLRVTEIQGEGTIELIRQAVLRLLPGKEPHAAFCRALPLCRYLAHGKVHIASHLTDVIEAIKEYPRGDRAHAESFARNMHNTTFQHKAEEDPTTFDWAKHFWRSNGELVRCLL